MKKKGRATMKEKLLSKDEVIFRQGDWGSEFYQVLEGGVKICYDMGTEEELLLTELHAGDFFGEMAVIEAYPRSASAVAAEDGTKIQAISAEEAVNYLEKSPEKACLLMEHIGDRIRTLTKDYSEAKSLLGEMGKAGNKSAEGSLASRIKKHVAYGRACRRFEKGESEEAHRLRKSFAKEYGNDKNIFTYSKGTLIFREGESSEYMYEIHGGCVGIYTAFDTPQEKELTTLGEGTFFGEMGMIVGEPRSATAVTLENNTVVEIISYKDLKEMFATNPPKAASIVQHLSYRLRMLTKDYANVCIKLAQYGE